MALEGEDRRRIGSVPAILKQIFSRNKTGAADLSRRYGVPVRYIYSAMRVDSINGKTLDVLAMCGYRVAFVPKGKKLPDGSYVLKRKIPNPETMLHIAPDESDAETEDDGYVEILKRGE